MEYHETDGNYEGLPVLASIENVLSQSKRVFFHPEKIERAIIEWRDHEQAKAGWQHPCHFFDSSAETARWIFVLDILNHCFWPDAGQPTWTVSYRGKPYSGYWALAASLKRAMENKIPITDASFLAQMSDKTFEEIFSGEGEIPLASRRIENLREAGKVLEERWERDIVNLIVAARGSAVKLVISVVSSFPSFRDEALYHGKRVYFWKRAQLFASDLFAAFGGKDWGRFHDIENLTAFADYKLPQVLRALGIISYDTRLEEKIDGMEKISSGSEEEVEIRAVTIRAVEDLKKALNLAGKKTTSIEVDNRLWQLGQLDPFRKKPYHRCRTIYY